MFTVQTYVLPKTLAEAYELNQKKGATVLGGCGWLKMSRRRIATAIDLSALGLDTIDENEREIAIGAMVTLRQLEMSDALRACFGSYIADSVRQIVGVQFRNCATVGGSVFARFGFSDVLTALLPLNAEVELVHAGRIPLAEFVNMPHNRDILVRVILPKTKVRAVYSSYRNTATDLPVVTVAAVRENDTLRVAVGARPEKAGLRVCPMPKKSELTDFHLRYSFSSNLRASADYRRHLAEVLLARALTELAEE